MPHLPPVDFRYGWHTARCRDQVLILFGLLVVGVSCLFAAPNCALWGMMVHGMSQALLTARRKLEEKGLQLLAMCAFIQHILGRTFIVENSGASKIFKESPLHVLTLRPLSSIPP